MVELKCIESDYVFIISETDKPYIEKYSWHYWKNNKGKSKNFEKLLRNFLLQKQMKED